MTVSSRFTEASSGTLSTIVDGVSYVIYKTPYGTWSWFSKTDDQPYFLPKIYGKGLEIDTVPPIDEGFESRNEAVQDLMRFWERANG